MSLRGVLMLTVAAVVGGIAVVLLRGWLETQVPKQVVMTGKQEPQIALATVVVAKRDLFFGDRLIAEFLEQTQWPADRVPPGAFSDLKALAAEGRVVVRPITKNEPVIATKLSGEGGRATLSSVLNDEMRAVTIRVNDVLGVAGFVLPGDRVDILLTREVSKDNPITDILLQNIKILGIDQNANDQEDDPTVVRSVTIEASPYQSQKLTLGAQVGTLSLALRNTLDVDAAPQRTVTLADLSGGEINRSPNQPLNGKNGAIAAGANGAAVTPASATATPASDGQAQDADAPPVVSTPLVDPFARITIVRGVQASQYKVRPGR